MLLNADSARGQQAIRVRAERCVVQPRILQLQPVANLPSDVLWHFGHLASQRPLQPLVLPQGVRLVLSHLQWQAIQAGEDGAAPSLHQGGLLRHGIDQRQQLPAQRLEGGPQVLHLLDGRRAEVADPVVLGLVQADEQLQEAPGREERGKEREDMQDVHQELEQLHEDQAGEDLGRALLVLRLQALLPHVRVAETLAAAERGARDGGGHEVRDPEGHRGHDLGFAARVRGLQLDGQPRVQPQLRQRPRHEGALHGDGQRHVDLHLGLRAAAHLGVRQDLGEVRRMLVDPRRQHQPEHAHFGAAPDVRQVLPESLTNDLDVEGVPPQHAHALGHPAPDDDGWRTLHR
mmetsp:Transcript_74557/g.242050  ORF Transcript_74557/g.242050 Transcript_74557/m.242050 type:complete len:346 (-) Transcript_74557:4051-5088(-)